MILTKHEEKVSETCFGCFLEPTIDLFLLYVTNYLWLLKGFMKLMFNILESSNMCVSCCTLSALHGSCLSVSKNMNYVAHQTTISKYSQCTKALNNAANQEDLIKGKLIRNLLGLIKNVSMYNSRFATDDVNCMHQYLCCN